MHLNFYPLTGFDTFQAYGKVEIGLYYALSLLGVQLTPLGRLRPDWHTFDQEARLLGQTKPLDVAEITLMTANLDRAGEYPVKHTRKWLYTMVECTRLGDVMVDEINRHAERVLVPIPRLVDIFQESGVKVPVHHIGYAADFCVPPYQVHTLPQMTPDDPFIFLTYSQGDYRKGGDLAISAFQEAYGGDKRFQLWVKVRDGYKDTWIGSIREQRLPQVRVIAGLQTDEAWFDLLHRAHCLIFPTRGEGIGYVGRDATQAGLPAITTQWMGQYDVDHWGIPLPLGKLTPVLHPGRFYNRHLEDNQWAEPSTEDLKRLMANVVANYATYAAQTRQGREYLLSLRYQDVARNIMRLVERYG